MKHRTITRWIAALGVLAAPLALATTPAQASHVLGLPDIVDLSVAISDTPDPVEPGGDVEYTITVSNSQVALPSDPTTASGELPFEITAAPSGCDIDGGTFSCPVDGLDPGASDAIEITATTTQSTAPGPHEASVSIPADALEPIANADNNSASTTTTVSADADLGVAVESLPEVVAPPGAGVVYRITVSNTGNVAADATAEGTLPTGFTYHGSLDDACAADGSDVSCPAGSVDPGESVVFDVQALTSTTTGLYDFTVSIDGDSDTATTEVANEDDGGGRPAFVCGGCSLTYSHPAIGTATLTVPPEYEGVFVRLSMDDTTLDAKANDCGTVRGQTASCDEALSIVFDEEEEDYQVEDPTNPIVVEYTPTQAPCSGVASQCAPIGYYDPSKDPEGPEGDPEPMPRCDGAGVGINSGLGIATVGGTYHVCADSTYKDGSLTGHVVLMKSNDPLLPPLNLG